MRHETASGSISWRPPGGGHSITAVLFDLDDTLVDHGGAVGRALGSWLPEAFGSARTSHALEAWFTAEARHMARWRAGELSFGEQRRERLRELLPLWADDATTDAAALDQLFEGYLRHYEAAWRAFADAHRCLDAVRATGRQVGVLTNGPRDQQNAKLLATGLSTRIDVVVTAEELGIAKPDPRAFQETCRRLAVEVSRTLYVGDSYEVDVVGARSAGLPALLLDRCGASGARGDAIRSLDELTALL